MKNVFKVLGIIALAVVIGFSFFACGDNNGGGGDNSGGGPVIVKGNGKTVPVTGVSLNKTSLSLAVGGSETLNTTVAPSNATNKDVTWTSSDTTKVTVSSNGVVKAVARSGATITVTTADGKKTDTCIIMVF